MSPEQIIRTQQARRILTMSQAQAITTGLVRPCWVCANVGHAHDATGCYEDRCPCGTRYLLPVWP